MIIIFFHFSYIFNTSLRHEYESKIVNENTYDEIILKQTRENMKFKKIDIFKVLEKCRETRLFISSKIYKNLISHYYSTEIVILSSILYSRFDNHLIKLILNLKLDKTKKVSNYVVSSFCTTKLIQNLIIVSSSDRIVSDNINLWNDFMMDEYNARILCLNMNKFYENEEGIDIQSCLRLIWINMQLNYGKEMEERYGKTISNYCRYLNSYDVFQTEKLLDVPYFRTEYFKIIEESIYSFNDSYDEKYFFLFSYHGFQHNRICKSSLVNLYRNNCYKSFMKYMDFFETDFDCNDIDIFYLKDKTFKLQKEEEFEYIMGLLQYISCSYKKHIICVLKKGTYDLEIINVSNPPIEMILAYYKSKNDVTEQIQKNIKDYTVTYFVSIVEGKEYRFIEKEGDLRVPSKCLRLKCSHILGNELLEEFFINLSKKCYFCNSEAEIIEYFEVDLFTNSVSNP